MIYTTVIWESAPSESVFIEFQRKTDEIAGNFEGNKLLSRQEDNSIMVTRTWPTREAAEAWIEYILQYNPVSAVIEE